MIRDVIVLAAVLLTLTANADYFWDVVRGNTQPRVVSWAIWAGAQAVGTVQAARAGQFHAACYNAACSIGCAAIAVAGWRHGDRKISHLETSCLILGSLAVALLAASAAWPALMPLAPAVLLSVAADFLAYLPTYQHGWRRPDEESLRPFVQLTIGAALTLAVTSLYVMTGVIYPGYLLAADAVMVLIILASPYRPQPRYADNRYIEPVVYDVAAGRFRQGGLDTKNAVR